MEEDLGAASMRSPCRNSNTIHATVYAPRRLTDRQREVLEILLKW